MIYLTNGNTPLNEAYNDEIVQEHNNTYQLTFRFPTSDPKWELLKEETFLTADDLHGEQDFYIFEVEKQQGYIQVYANQVFTLLNNYVVNPISLDRQTGSTALSRFAGSITRDNPFSFFSDIEDRHTFNIDSKNAMEAFAKDKHSIIGQWGGDLVRHGYQVQLLKNGGSENESLFMYKKNLSSYQHKTSTKSLKTRITFKTTVKGEGEKPVDKHYKVVVDSPLINKYSQIYEDVVEVNDQDVVDEATLLKYGKQYFRTTLCDMLEDSLELEVVGQSDVPVQMFDIVSIFHEHYNLDVRKKITKYTYSPMAKKLKSIGFGQFQSGLANAIGNAVSDAVKGEAQQLQDDFERQLARELKNADLAFDRQKEELVNQFTDGLNAAKARAEEVKRQLSDTIDQRFSSFNNGPLQEAKRRAEEALRNAGASSLLAQEAKRIGLDSVAKLEEFKRQATSAQTALLGDLDVLKRTIANDIRPKQAQAEAEIAKQVEALSRTKNELAGVKSAQSTYEETTTRRLSELTNLANGKASKSELTQTAEELASKIASVRVGGRNYIRGTRRMALANGLWTSGTFRPSGVGTTKTIDVSNSPATGFDKAIRLTSSNARDQIGIAQDRFEIMPGTYTISVWVKGSVGQRVKLQTYWAPDDATGISPDFILKDDKWTYLTFSSERKKAGIVSIGYVYLVNADAGKYLDVLAPQLENGSLATSPKEAPEDTDGQISAVESTFKQRADSLDAGVSRLTEGLRAKADISSLNVTAENIRQSVKRLETNTQNKLDQKLSTAEFEVQAGSIRQEILNATKDKADKTLVVAEAGKLREEFSKMKVGSRNYAEDYDFSRRLWYYTQGDNSPQDWTIANGEYNVKGTTNTWKQMQIYSREGSHALGKKSTALLELEIGETYTLSFQGICYSGSSSVWLSLRANRTVSGYAEIMYGNFNLTSSWQTYQVTIPALTKPENFDFWRIILGYNEIGHVAFRKVELTRSSTRIDAGPAPEDGKTDLVVAKSEFQKTADGLSAKLATVENYVGQDGQRQEALRRYTREESAKQATSVRELVTRDYVGKSAYQEDVRGIERRLEAITNPQNGSIATQIAKYKTAVDGRFADITSMIAGKANQVDFQRVRETSQLYERILGNTENGIADKVARMAMTNQLFQVEVGKAFADHQNLFLTSTLTKGFLGNNGIIYVANATQKEVTSDFISVDPNEKIIFQHWVTLPENGMAWTAWQFFDKNKNPIDNRKPGLNAYKTTVGKQHNINQITVPANAYFVRFSARMYDDGLIKVEKGSAPSDYSVAPNDALEAVKTVQRQLDGSWAVQNINGVGSIVSQINATNNQILIEAEKIRLKGKTLLDELTAIQGYFKRLFVGDASVGTLNSDIIRSNSITADKLVMDMAMARRFVSSDIFTDTLAAKEAFINKLRSVVVTATLLEGFQGLIGGFRFGQYTNRNGYFITGTNSVSVGMGNGMNAGANRNAFWANWGESLDTPGPKAWYVNTDGKMYCRNEATFHSKVDFSSISNPNFYSKIKAHKGVWVGTDDVNGEGDNPAGGYNAVVWWSQIVTGKFRQHAGITTGSDRKLKENIEPTPVKALDKINALNLVAFDYIKDKTHEEIGLIAQEVLNIIPSSVEKYEDEDNHLTINYSKFVPYLIKAIQELNQKIEKMEKTIA
nr:MAG TPA: Neck appendage protein [Caudoviricetes sp.]